MPRSDFITEISGYVCKHAPRYDILVPSAVIAQAIQESGWGQSVLSKQYHNYFGLKCGTLWKGASVNLETQEEYQPGVMTTISDNFRTYGSMEEGVIGYFEFIQLPRYQNLRGIADPRRYLETIRADGYATDYSYVDSCMALVTGYNLTQYDGIAPTTGVTAQDVLDLAASQVGKNEADGSHRSIIDTYNSHTPLAQNYRLGYTDSWCDAFISSLYIMLNATYLIGGTECGVERHVEIFKKAKIWEEDGTVIPEPADIIVFDWDKSSQPNDGFADHIGLVESVTDGIIHTIEGNASGAVRRRTYRVGDGNIRGYARPRYKDAQEAPEKAPETPGEDAKPQVEEYPLLVFGSQGEPVRRLQRLINDNGGSLEVDGLYGYETRAAVYRYQRQNGLTPDGAVGPQTWGALMGQKSLYDIADEVIKGLWGNGEDRRKRLSEAGYDYDTVQGIVNKILRA